MTETERNAIIIGAGPAGLTAALELLRQTDIKPIVLEQTDMIGGISRTVNYKGYRIDIGGHRFFSKSDEVVEWWHKILPPAGKPAWDDRILGREIPVVEGGPDPEETDRVLLIRKRLSRIYYLKRFFDYPVTLSLNTLKNLGPERVARIITSYAKVRLFPIKQEKSLEDFFINRFGRELYETFFRDYTQKVWGVPCSEIKPDWGAQRVKGLSISKVLAHGLKKAFGRLGDVRQKSTETSLIEWFFYPKFGPGQLWEEVAQKVKSLGGEILMEHKAVGLKRSGNRIIEAEVIDLRSGRKHFIEADFFFSSMPVRELIESLGDDVPAEVMRVASGLKYRSFMTVGLLLNRLKIRNETAIKTLNGLIPDNWIYIQEKEVKLGRLQVFNNWSPYLLKDRNKVWLGLEYFCDEGDELWNMEDRKFAQFAVDELSKIDIIDKSEVLDYTVLRMPKTYPAYFGTYEEFHVIKDYVNEIENLFLIGRNGMHRYNNQDHSMLTAMRAVDNIRNGIKSKENIWAVNVEGEYHEEKNKGAA